MPGGGSLQIRDAAEAYELEVPTTLTGSMDQDTGVISGASFATPQVSFEQQVTSPLSATAFIDATFAQVTPGAATGTIDHEGEMTVDLQLTVDLHIEVVPAGATTPIDLPGDCRATPVGLNLTSSSPYDLVTEQVTLATTDFTVPPVAVDDDCTQIIADAVNDQLAGAGHALSLTMEGDITPPPPAGCATTTILAVTPAGGAAVGDAVTLAATVAPVAGDPECQAAATDGVPLVGVVEFRDGTRTFATVTLDSAGQAGTTTTALPAGTRTLTARYRGSPPYQASSSDPTGYPVAARPVLTTRLPATIEVGAAPVEFDITVTNTDFGAPVDGARLDVTIRRTPGSSIQGLLPAHLALEVLDGTDWVPVALTSPAVRTVLGPVGTIDVAPGEALTRRARLAAGHGGAPVPQVGPLDIVLEVVDEANPPAAGPTAAAIASGTSRTLLVNADRLPTTLGFASAAQGGPVSPHTVRAGNSVTIPSVSITSPVSTGIRPSGFAEVLLDGAVVPVAAGGGLLDPGFGLRRPVNGSLATTLVNLPPDIGPGTHTLAVRYLGDALYEGSVVVASFTVVPPLGSLYECTAEGAPDHRFRAQVIAQANLPSSAPAGSEVDLDQFSVKVLTDRSFITVNSFGGLLTNDAVNMVGAPESFEGVSFAVGPDGSGTATGIDRRLGTRMAADPNPATTDIDHGLTFLGESGSVVIDGARGASVPVTLDAVQIETRTDALGIPYNHRCLPVGEPITLGSVTVAGVGLAVSPASVTRAGQEVTLSATTAPSTATGVVEFRDGTSTVGVVPVVAGAASMTTTDLAPGEHGLTARFFPQPMMPALTSELVALTVWPEHDCAAFTEEGSGAVVRLVYLELLGRCPDPAGYDHWVGRLDGGTSPTAFARSIARTPEAVGRVVDDAYEAMLGRGADPAGRAFWVGRLQVSGRYDQLLADLGGSGELWTKAGATNSGFVTRIYERLLHRAPDAGGLEHWVGRLEAGTSRRGLVLTLANLDEPLGRLVALSYDEILGRAPSASERRRGIEELRATGDRSGLYARLIGTQEFHDRAQDLPNPED